MKIKHNIYSDDDSSVASFKSCKSEEFGDGHENDDHDNSNAAAYEYDSGTIIMRCVFVNSSVDDDE